jgi:hypothetical protein
LAAGFLTVGVFQSPAARDIAVGSPEVVGLNAVAESFPRIGIRHEIDKRWSLVRLIGDASGGRGPQMVGWMDVAVGAAVGGAIGAAIFQQWGLVQALVRFVYYAVMTDRWWNRVTSGGGRSDGFIQASSQWYPGAIENFVAEDATSHTGQTKTQRSYVEVERVLADFLGLDRRTEGS